MWQWSINNITFPHTHNREENFHGTKKIFSNFFSLFIILMIHSRLCLFLTFGGVIFSFGVCDSYFLIVIVKNFYDTKINHLFLIDRRSSFLSFTLLSLSREISCFRTSESSSSKMNFVRSQRIKFDRIFIFFSHLRYFGSAFAICYF